MFPGQIIGTHEHVPRKNNVFTSSEAGTKSMFQDKINVLMSKFPYQLNVLMSMFQDQFSLVIIKLEIKLFKTHS